MYICENLNKNNFKYLIDLNSKRSTFNELNQDFIDEFKRQNLLKKLIIKKNVHLLKSNDKYIGFMWIKNGLSKYQYEINAMNIAKEYIFDISTYIYLINSFKYAKMLSYRCEKNLYNYDILKKLNFYQVESNYELEIDLKEYFELPKLDSISIEKLKKREEEEIRCFIQNEVFQKNGRIPITVDDIYCDEVQDYYVDDGSFFIKKDGSHIGYGQFIVKNGEPTVVNFGILKFYRGKGYGRYFLKYILNCLKKIGYNKAYIKVDTDNTVAINLYKSVGFTQKSSCSLWEKKVTEK